MNYYLVRFTDTSGTARMSLQEADDLRTAMNNFYLDECPSSIESIQQVKEN
jgi:hypothetical protein